jgi:membrane-bound inhibitor of C-type lysozyme
MRYKVIIPSVLVIIIVALFFWLRPHTASAPAVTDTPKRAPLSSAQYICNNKKTIDAAFYEGAKATTTIATNTPPIPTGTVDLNLSDGRNLTLHQTISADGARYADAGETFVFWSKGNGALVTDKGDEKSYWGCVTSAPATDALPNVYHDGHNGFTIRYANDWNIDSAYTYRLRGPNEVAPTGVKFRIPLTMATGTNLSALDTGISVEIASSSNDMTTCSASTFASQPVTAATSTINTIEYSVASTSDAGAGNFYEEHIFALPYSRPCIAVRYFIHSTNIGNYTPGTIKEFDKTVLLKQFDAIRGTLVTQ